MHIIPFWLRFDAIVSKPYDTTIASLGWSVHRVILESDAGGSCFIVCCSFSAQTASSHLFSIVQLAAHSLFSRGSGGALRSELLIDAPPDIRHRQNTDKIVDGD